VQAYWSNAAGRSSVIRDAPHAPDRWEPSKGSAGNPRGSDRAPGPTPRPIRSSSGRQPSRKESHQVKIAQVALLYESVPPRLYGGTERIVAHLADALVNLGHDAVLSRFSDP